MNTWSIIHFIVAIVSLIWCFLNLQVCFASVGYIRLVLYLYFIWKSLNDPPFCLKNFPFQTQDFNLQTLSRVLLKCELYFIYFLFLQAKRKLSHYHLHSTNAIYWTWAKYIEKVCNGVIFDRYIHNSPLRMHCAICIWIFKLIQNVEHPTSSWISYNRLLLDWYFYIILRYFMRSMNRFLNIKNLVLIFIPNLFLVFNWLSILFQLVKPSSIMTNIDFWYNLTMSKKLTSFYKLRLESVIILRYMIHFSQVQYCRPKYLISRLL